MTVESKALLWAKKNKNYKWLKKETIFTDLTKTKKAILVKAYENRKTTKKGNARKDKPVGSRLAFDATKQEADKKKKMKPPPIPPNIKGKKIKQTTGQKNLQALLGLGDLASMIVYN